MKKKPSLEQLKSALLESWTPRTDIEMSEILIDTRQISAGQCAITTLVVQDYLGGEILKTIASAPDNPDVFASHYLNFINESIVDLTKDQFQKDTVFSKLFIDTQGYSSVREYTLSHKSTVDRYKLLKSRVEKILNK